MIILSFTHHLTRSDKKDITNILTFTKDSLISLPIALISLVILIYTINNPYPLTKTYLITYQTIWCLSTNNTIFTLICLSKHMLLAYKAVYQESHASVLLTKIPEN
jgi:hypothetical protein